jgi:hypothetical protein
MGQNFFFALGVQLGHIKPRNQFPGPVRPKTWRNLSFSKNWIWEWSFFNFRTFLWSNILEKPFIPFQIQRKVLVAKGELFSTCRLDSLICFSLMKKMLSSGGMDSEKHCVKKSVCHGQWFHYGKTYSAQKAPGHVWVLSKTSLTHVGTIRRGYRSSQCRKSVMFWAQKRSKFSVKHN